MERLLPIVKEAVVSGLIAQATHRDRRSDMAGIGLIIFAGVVFLLAVIFCAMAGYHWLAQQYSTPVSFSIIAGTLLVTSALFFVLGQKAMGHSQRNSTRRSREEISKLFDIVTDELSQDIAEPVKENPKTSLAAAAIAGFLAGDRIH